MMLGNMEECRDRKAGRGLEKIICLKKLVVKMTDNYHVNTLNIHRHDRKDILLTNQMLANLFLFSKQTS